MGVVLEEGRIIHNARCNKCGQIRFKLEEKESPAGDIIQICEGCLPKVKRMRLYREKMRRRQQRRR